MILFFFVTFHWCWFGNCCYFMCCLCCRRHSWPTFCWCVRYMGASKRPSSNWKQWQDSKQKNETNASWLLLLVEMVVAARFWSNRFRFVYGYFDVKPCAVCTANIMVGSMEQCTHEPLSSSYIYSDSISCLPFQSMLLLGQRERKYMPHWIKCIYETKPSLLFYPIFPPPSILWQYAAAAAVHSIFHTLMHNVYIKETGRVSESAGGETENERHIHITCRQTSTNENIYRYTETPAKTRCTDSMVWCYAVQFPTDLIFDAPVFHAESNDVNNNTHTHSQLSHKHYPAKSLTKTWALHTIHKPMVDDGLAAQSMHAHCTRFVQRENIKRIPSYYCCVAIEWYFSNHASKHKYKQKHAHSYYTNEGEKNRCTLLLICKQLDIVMIGYHIQHQNSLFITKSTGKW